jgi:hypothetical protein
VTGDAALEMPPMTINITHEGIDQMVRALAPLVRLEDRRLLDPRPRPEHVPLIDELRALRWDRPDPAAERAFELLLGETTPGGSVDPCIDEADVPWCLMLVCLVEVPHLGAHAARRWFRHLFRLQVDDVPVSTVVEAVAAYSVAAFCSIIGLDEEVRRWMHTASIVGEHDERPMIGLLAYVRAVRLLEAVLRRCR